jgi:hypothetical protein
VSALRLYRRKFAEKSTDSIRRKFSIDGFYAPEWHIHHFETIPGRFRKPDIHHSRRIVGRDKRESPPKQRLWRAKPAP